MTHFVRRVALYVAKLSAHDRATINKTKVAGASLSFAPTASATTCVDFGILGFHMK